MGSQQRPDTPRHHPGARRSRLLLLLLPPALLSLACGETVATPESADPVPPLERNLALVLLDDWGVELSTMTNPDGVTTPNLASVASGGLRISDFYVSPNCVSSRVSLATGYHVTTTGWRSVGHGPLTFGMDESFGHVARDNGYRSGYFGKWHIAGRGSSEHRHVLTGGYDRFVGTTGNIGPKTRYDDWRRNVNGVVSPETEYALTNIVDAAIEFVTESEEKFFIFVSTHSIHVPLHVPPPGLTYSDVVESPTNEQLTRYMAEAVDIELQRLFDALPRNTLIILLGDNGTSSISQPEGIFPRDNSKGSSKAGGTRVPLSFTGPGVVDLAIDYTATHVDLYATVTSLLGTPIERDGFDFRFCLDDPWLCDGERRPRYVERQPEPGRFAQRATDGLFSYLYDYEDAAQPEFYDLRSDPYEEDDLIDGRPLTLEEDAALERLRPLVEARRPLGIGG